MRKVVGLKWAKELPGRPKWLRTTRPQGAKAAGLRYERLVGKALPEARRGVWWEFEDEEGVAWCQTDFLIPRGDGWVLAEVKYPWTPMAYAQVQELYAPVLKWVLRRRFLGAMLVCKNLLPQTPRDAICGGLGAGIDAIGSVGLPVVHWIGTGPIDPPLRDRFRWDIDNPPLGHHDAKGV